MHLNHSECKLNSHCEEKQGESVYVREIRKGKQIRQLKGSGTYEKEYES